MSSITAAQVEALLAPLQKENAALAKANKALQARISELEKHIASQTHKEATPASALAPSSHCPSNVSTWTTVSRKRPTPKEDSPPKPNKRSATVTSKPASSINKTPQVGETKPTKKERIPPIVLREKDKYNLLATACKEAGISFSLATNISHGIKIHPKSSDDYRSIVKFLEDKKIEHHSYALEEEKSLHIVLRNVSEAITEEEICGELISNGFHPTLVQRWKNKSGKPIPMVLVLVPKSEKSIFNIPSIGGMRVIVESQHAKSKATQCHNCQIFGHSAAKCKASPKCVKCAGDHHTSSCSKPRDTPAKCFNCSGDHPASFKGCPRHPLKLKESKALNKPKKAIPPPTFVWGSQNSKPASPKEVIPKPQPAPRQAPTSLSTPAPQMAQALEFLNKNMISLVQNFQEQLIKSLTIFATPIHHG